MQIKMQAFVRHGGSLRQRIARDLEKHGHERLYLEKSKSVERSPGWAKIKATGAFGAINIEWDPNQQMLTARAIAKKRHLPHELLGIFLAYLTERHGRRISSINIQLT